MFLLDCSAAEAAIEVWQVLERGERIELLVDKTEQLHQQVLLMRKLTAEYMMPSLQGILVGHHAF